MENKETKWFVYSVGTELHNLLLIDLSNGVGVGVGIGIELGLRNISEVCFKTTKVNKYKSIQGKVKIRYLNSKCGMQKRDVSKSFITSFFNSLTAIG